MASDARPANPLRYHKTAGRQQLSPEQQRVEARKMEIYAAMVDNLTITSAGCWITCARAASTTTL
jgi:hypothetical protein